MGNTKTKYDFESGLSENCWQLIISYLDVVCQVRLAQASKRVSIIFKNYARRRYKHIDENLIKQLSAEELEQLLQLVGDQVQSYAKFSSNHKFEILYKRHFDIILQNCKHLQRFAFYQVLLTPDLAYEITSQLSKLQHLFLRTDAVGLRAKFLDALASAQLESLVLRGSHLTNDQMERVCNISSLKDLDVCCTKLPLDQLLKLHKLEKLHLTQAWFTTNQRIKLKIYVYRSGINWERLNKPLYEKSKHLLYIKNKSNRIPNHLMKD